MKRLFFLCLALLPLSAQALSPEANRGAASFGACLACHNADIQPPLAPTMAEVRAVYLEAHPDKAAFIDRVANFAAMPSEEAVLLPEAVESLGLMVAFPLPDAVLRDIAAYIYEHDFAGE